MFFNSKKILGINARNLLYIRPYNNKKAIQFADNKLKTKYFLSVRGIPTAKVYNIIRNREELSKFDFNSLPDTFVLKPNSGYGGEGIIPIIGRKDGKFLKADNEIISHREMYDHTLDLLDGRFSISNLPDLAFFEHYILSHETLAKYSYRGLPDLRIVVHNLIPIMAMLRLPTKESGGKANLHQNAIGVGIDIATGETTHLIRRGKTINKIPGIEEFERIKIPYFDDILKMSSKIQLITNLGFLACDFAIDRVQGPVLLEINARAGLMVQVANLIPLRQRLEKVKGIKVSGPEHAVRIVKDIFGKRVERGIQNISGKYVIGIEETVEIILKNKNHRVKVLSNPGIERTVIDRDFAREIGLLIDENQSDIIHLKLAIDKARIQTAAQITNLGKNRKYKIILGRRDLTNFFIDPRKKEQKITLPKLNTEMLSVKPKSNIDFHYIDQQLTLINKQIKLINHLKPKNLLLEKEKFLQNTSYNPQFTYSQLDFNPYELKERLSNLKTDDSPLGILFNEKISELINKIDLLISICSDDFTTQSIRLYGFPTGSDLFECREKIKKIDFKNENKELEIYGYPQIKEEFQKVLESYKLENWEVKAKNDIISACVIGKNSKIYIKEDIELSEKRLKSLIVHEIETHVLSAENGRMQPYQLFHTGTAGYLTTQEGLAIYNVSKIIDNSYRYLLLVECISQGVHSSFSKLAENLLDRGLTKIQAFDVVAKVKRGVEDTSQPGVFTKDYIYFKGYKEIKNYVKSGGDIKKLYIGKINHADLDLISKIEGIKPPQYLPEWIK
ncbi:MAG: alpha-l-glutamate ligase-like protein [Candidatus Peregrinibacteria bacterium GW2011_GWC2_33_13]|nr:MAG: alpha-l-glutamate ligase-like protein [Candidatus Peregrinibacteria bacterium GW2011_GWC2_33_13]